MQLSFIDRLARLDALAAKCSGRMALVSSGLAVVMCLLGFQWLKNQLGTMMLDEIPGYDRDMLVEHMLFLGAAGRNLHMWFTLTLDFVFPLAYGVFFAGLLVLAARGLGLKGVVVPVLAVMVLDYAENIQLAMMLGAFPELTTAQISAASATTLGKFWAIRFALYWLAGLTAWRVFKAVRARAAK